MIDLVGPMTKNKEGVPLCKSGNRYVVTAVEMASLLWDCEPTPKQECSYDRRCSKEAKSPVLVNLQ